MARFVRFDKVGGPEVLRVVEAPTPSPGPGEVLVEIRAAGVNPIDWKLRSGVRPLPPFTGPPGTGSDAAGIVAAVGEGVTGWSEGDAVIVVGADGAYATHTIALAEQLVAKPAEVSFEVAAALGIPVATAYQALKSLGVGVGDRFIVHGGSGSVGQAAVQLAIAWGADVVATARPENHERLREIGAVPVAYGPGLLERLKEASPEGYTVALDAGGSEEALQSSMELIADHDRIGTVVIGRRADELGLRAWAGGSARPLSDEEIRLRAEAIPAVVPLVAAGGFDVEIGRILPLTEAAEAQRLSEAGEVRGKIILVP